MFKPYSVRFWLVIIGALLTVSSGQITQAQTLKQSKWTGLSGTWRLNNTLSARWSRTISQEIGGDLILSPVAFGPGNLEVTPGKANANEVRVLELLDATRTLEIFQQRRAMTVNATGSQDVLLSRTFSTNVRPQDMMFGQVNIAGPRARWAPGKLVIETRSHSGPLMTETYEVSDGRLYLSLKIQNGTGSRPYFVLRIYDKVTA
jgi:hypothetical protein